MPSKIRIALAQMEITLNLEKNLEKIMAFLQGSSSRVLLFPELALTGYQTLGASFKATLSMALKEIQKVASNKLIFLGAPYFYENHPVNAYYAITSQEIQVVAEKELLFPGLDDTTGFLQGKRRKLIHLDHTLWGVILCFELRSPELSRDLLKKGIDGLLVPAEWPLARIEHFKTLLKARALENQIFVIGINGVGKCKDLTLGGNSAIYNPLGEKVLSCSQEEEMKEAVLDLSFPALPYPLKTPYPKPSKLCTLEEVKELSEKRRKKGQILVFTNGCFDILHAGHVDYLKQARRLGDFLVVGINSDLSVSHLKGPTRPVNPQALRIEVLSALDCVDYLVLFDEETPENLIRALRPDVLVKGADWPEEKIVGADFVKSYGGKVVRVEFSFEISTTALIQKIREK